jgi:uncharacterized protein (DUF924 family)
MAIDKQFDVKIEPDKRVFLYMPFMHSESINDQDQSVTLFKTAGLIENVKFAEHHRDIIRQFGRFPHRNAILGRDSTEAEVEYLQSDKAFHG